MVQLKVHLIEGFLHMLHMGGGHLNEIVAVPQDGAQLANRLGRAKGGAQKANRVQILQPLAVRDVRLTAGNVFHVVGIDEEDFKAPRFEDLEQRNPIDTSGLHGHGLDTTLFQPVGQLQQLGGKGRESAHGVRDSIGRHGDINLAGSDVDSRGVGSEHRERDNRRGALFSLLNDSRHKLSLKRNGESAPRPKLCRTTVIS